MLLGFKRMLEAEILLDHLCRTFALSSISEATLKVLEHVRHLLVHGNFERCHETTLPCAKNLYGPIQSVQQDLELEVRGGDVGDAPREGTVI